MLRFGAGIATALQQCGLAPFSPVEPWLVEHPERIVSVLSSFRDAGSTHSLTPTFLAAADPLSVDRTVQTAVQLVRRAGLVPWGSSGPVAVTSDDYGSLARALVRADVNQLTLETFTCGEDALRALDAALAVAGMHTVVLSVVPSDDGSTTRDGQPLGVWAERAFQRGAAGVGINCVAPRVALASAEHLAGVGPLWFAPSGSSDWAASVRPLRQAATWLGGCCGVGAADLRDLWSDS